MNIHANQDPQEIARFETAAQRWWDPQGEFRPLHDLNPIRTDYIDARAPLAGKRVLDIGCGGGLLCEAMAKRGADVTGIDLGSTALQVAELHALESGVRVRYLQEAAEFHAAHSPAAYDVVTCLEMLEHVPDPPSVVAAAAALVKPGGNLFFSTLNRNLKAYLLAVVGAEYVMNLLPRGTHTYARFIRPSELARWGRIAGLQTTDVCGIEYNPLTRSCRLNTNADVNYIMHFTS
jgi:2-polyprenyl-6-hydroxyphenyl methylase/3-demethylubiquinone-9 3-methyltransferase